MINVAESRGLFGDENKDGSPKKSAVKQSGRASKKKEEVKVVHKGGKNKGKMEVSQWIPKK